MSTSDEELATALTASAKLVDPPPALLFEMAKAAFGLRLLDAELAELVADSLESAGAVRGPTQERLLAFEAEQVTVDVQVSLGGDQRRLVGQLSGGTDLRLDTAGSSTSVPLDELGRFVIEGVSPGPIRLRTTTGSGRTVTTAWTVI